MPSKAKAGKGTRLQRGDGGSPDVFTTIGEVRSYTGPSRSMKNADVTSYDSTAEEFIATIKGSGEVSFELLYVGSDTQQQGLVTDMDAGTLRNFKLILNDHATTPSSFAFAALVAKVDGPSAAPDAALKVDVTLKISGAVTSTYAP